jgi:ribosomal protein S18
MRKKLFVSNLDFEVSNDQLFEIFSKVGGCVSATVAVDRETRRSKGFGFIEMENEEVAIQAIEQLNGMQLNGRPIKVVEDRGKTGAPVEGRDAGGGEGGRRHEILPPIQRMQLFKRRRKLDPFTQDPSRTVDYRDVATLSRFLSERGRILSRRMTGLSSYNQRKVSKAIKRAQNLGLMPFSAI